MSDSFIVPSNDPFFSRFVSSRNKQDILVRCGEREYASSEMSGGSYSNYSKMKLASREPLSVNMGTGYPAFTRGENVISEDEVFVEQGFFQGKLSRPKITLHPNTIEKYRPRKKCVHNHPDCLLNAELSELCAESMPYLSSRRERILHIFSLVGKYKSIGLRNNNVLGEEVAELIEMGYLEKKGGGVGKTLQARNYKYSSSNGG